ncbi:MAG: tetratricopeptide repeat protein [Oscillospiraceae bacterium]
MDKQTAYEMLEYIARDKTVPEEYSEYAASCIGTDGTVFDEPMSIACDMTELLPCGDIPEPVSDFVVCVYLDEIENGNADAMCDLGALYYNGRGVEQSYEKAVKYYTMSAELGCEQAAENLGYCYYYGRSVDIDYKKAYHYFIKGALNDRPVSLYKIGDMYAKGYYVDKDEREAFLLYKRCYMIIDSSDSFCDCSADVCIRLADAFFCGMGTDVNHHLALKLAQRAEQDFYVKLANGDIFSRSGLKRALDLQEEIRAKINESLMQFS